MRQLAAQDFGQTNKQKTKYKTEKISARTTRRMRDAHKFHMKN